MDQDNELQIWLRAMKRIPWSAAKPELKTIGIDTSIGWNATISPISTWDQSSNRYKSVLADVKTMYHAHLHTGEKLILWFHIPQTDIPIWSANFLNMQQLISKTFNKPFPLPIDSVELQNVPEYSPELTRIENNEDAISLVYCSKRSFNLREEIMPQRFSPADKKWLEQFEQIVGYKRVEFQAFDIVWLDKRTGLLELRIDAPEGLSQDETKTSRNALLDKFYSDLNKISSINTSLLEPINFFPAIERMYKAGKEGSVFELYFSATTGSNNYGKMKNKGVDLRSEAFHKAGTDKVGITPYRLGILWQQRGRLFHPELHLPGSLHLFSGRKMQPLTSAYIRNCISFDDYKMVSNRFLKYL